MKKCKYCLKYRKEENFPIAVKTIDKILRRKKCNICYKEMKAARRKKIREAVQKLRVKCHKCGNKDPRVLDFHHKNKKSKYANIADMAKSGLSFKRILKEIEKCDCICSNCHRIWHYESTAIADK